MFSQDDIALWHQISRDSAEVCRQFASSYAREEFPHHEAILPLRLPEMQHSILQKLISIGITKDTAAAIDQAYRRHLEEVASKFSSEYSRDQETLVGLGDAESIDRTRFSLWELYTRQFTNLCTQSEQKIIEHASQYVLSQASVSPSNLPANLESRTWDDRTRETLEEAWQRNTKLNMAEKKRLAATTGLSIRQISIWVSAIASSEVGGWAARTKLTGSPYIRPQFANQRQRRKPYATSGTTPRKSTSPSRQGTPHLQPTHRKTSSSSCVSTDSTSTSRVPSLSSSVSSSSSSSSTDSPPHTQSPAFDWNNTPTYILPELLSSFEQKPSLPSLFDDRAPSDNSDHSAFVFKQGDSAGGNSSGGDVAMMEQQHPTDSTGTYCTLEQFTLPNLDLFLTQSTDLSPVHGLTNFNLPDTTFDAGINTDEFWRNILAESNGNATASGGDGMPSVTIAPAVDDWSSIFADMDFSTFFQPQP